MLIIYLVIAWAAGIILAEATQADLPYGVIAVGLAMLFGMVWPFGHRRLTFALACIALVALGAWRLDEGRPEQSPGHIAQYNNSGWTTIYGTVRTEPDERDTYTNVQVEVDRVESLGAERETHGTVLVRFPANSEVAYGDRILASGQLRPPPNLDTFNYRDKLARQGIFSFLQPANTRILSHDHGVWTREVLIEAKSRAQGFIEDSLPEPQASLLSGILLGDDKGMAYEVKEAFNDTGTSHVIAISGFNMAIIAGMVATFLGALFGRDTWSVIVLSILFITIYTIFVGANAAVVRAAVMSGVLILAPKLGGQTYVPASLAATALVMSLLDPWVLWDIGFQLSFAAVLGMALLTPSFDRTFRGWMQRSFGRHSGIKVAQWLSEPLIVSIVAQIFTLPIILYYFGRLSLVSPIVNLLIVPVQSLILLLGGAATATSFVYAPIGEYLYDATWLCLAWTTTVVRQFADIPLAAAEFSLPQWSLIGLFGGTFVMTVLHGTRPPWFEHLWNHQIVRFALQGALVVGALVIIGALVQQAIRQPDDELHVIYLDMGQSNSVLIETPEGATFLIDGGRYPSRLLTALGDHLPPNQRQIDVWLITSDDYNDIGGLVTIAERYDIEVVIDGIQNSNEQEYYDLLDALVEQDATILDPHVGWRLETGDGVSIEILSPRTDRVTPETMVLRLAYGEASFLFINELAAADENLLLAQPHLIQATVLQAADHAMDKSNSETWIQQVNPQVVIVHNDPSSRDNGAIGHVMARFADREVYRTDQHGTIEVITNGKQLRIRTESN
ncbi:MAG: DUF4131 domain-containing protein [Chloroflexi bacterium]|nr:DUF4131 domain-containing protein [Chloroflexota bacterium]